MSLPTLPLPDWLNLGKLVELDDGARSLVAGVRPRIDGGNGWEVLLGFFGQRQSDWFAVERVTPVN